MNTAFGDPKIL